MAFEDLLAKMEGGEAKTEETPVIETPQPAATEEVPATPETPAEVPADTEEVPANPENPAEDTAKPAEEAVATEAAAAFDFSFLEDAFGEKVASPDEVKAKVLDLKDKLKVLSEAPVTTFVNDDVRKFNEFVKETGISDYEVFSRVAKSGLTETSSFEEMVDTLVARDILRDPENKSLESVLRRQYMRQFSQEIEEDATEEERDTIAMRLKTLRYEAKDANAELSKIREKLSIEAPKPIDAAEIQAEKQRVMQSWEPVINQNVEKLTFDIPKVDVANGKVNYLADKELSVNFDSEQKAEYASHFKAYLQFKGVPKPDESSLSEAHAYAYKEVAFNSIPRIVAEAVKTGINMERAKSAAVDLNPSAIAKPEQKEKGGITNDQATENFVNKAYGG
jgi:hypothetical protein